MIRNEAHDLLSFAEDLQSDDSLGVLATLFSSRGSTYRTLGSMMLGEAASSEIVGGVSGGCLETYILRRGLALTEERPAAMFRFVDDPRATRSEVPVLGCGGSVDVLVERFSPKHREFLQAYAAAHESDRPSIATCLVERSGASGISVRRELWTEGGDASDLDECAMLAREAFLAGRSLHGHIEGDRLALVEYVFPMTRLVILGAGEDAKPVCALGRSLGWHVTVADRRARLATRERFRDADQVVVADWGTALRSIAFTPRTAVVVMTHSLSDDAQIVPLLVERAAFYRGALGPERRREWLLEGANGALPEPFVRSLRGPIGLNLGERSAGGIAVSIVAEILAELNGRDARSLHGRTDEFTETIGRAVFDAVG